MRDLGFASRTYVVLPMAIALGLAWASLSTYGFSREQLLTAMIIAAAAAVAHVLRAASESKQAFALTSAFVFAGALLLPPSLLAPVVIIAFVPEYIRYHRSLSVTLFNVVNVLINTYAAYIVASALGLTRPELILTVGGALAALAAVVVFIGTNRLIIAGMLRIARGCSWEQTGLLELDPFLTDLAVASVGILVALMWTIQPLLSVFIVFPLYLVHRALDEPVIREMARNDRKTGLYSAQHFERALSSELNRAKRFGHSVSVAMIDLDMMRVINNTHGQRGGDAVIKGIARLVRESIREYDVAARFGGEEFALVLPGCGHSEAVTVCERLRTTVASAEFPIPTSRTPVTATLSAGVASYPQDSDDPNVLVSLAVQAVHMAKARGRNRVGAWTLDDTETRQVATVPTAPVQAPSSLTSLDTDAWRESGLPRFALAWATIEIKD